ncbi:MAG: lipopolysaccharide export system protein LptC [Paracoccaceae bacterium]|jgi:lipopolysaccharide export system protein LptC
MVARSLSTHSRIVAWTKIVLPLAALAILSSLFLFSKTNDPGKGVRLFDGDLAEFASKERITGPRFAGMTPSGVAIQISAREASPRSTGGPAFDAFDLNARIELLDRSFVDVVAQQGSIDSLNQLAELTGGITLITSDGYVAKTFGLSISLDKLDISSQGEITAIGPIGDVSAGSMQLQLSDQYDTSEQQGYDLVFKNGIKLIYRP